MVAAELSNTGSISVQAGTFEVTTDFTNQGLITISGGAGFIGSGAFANVGTIQGDGTVASRVGATLLNAGLIAPGDGIGTLTLDGDLQMAEAGRVQFQLASLGSFDSLVITDDASFAGIIEVANFGYRPVVGDSFVVITLDERLAGSTFDSLAVTGFGAGVDFSVSYLPGQVVLNVVAVPEPGTWAMWLAGLAATVGLSRRRT